MEPYYSDEAVEIYLGDCREFEGSADVIVTDPPYGLEFMGMAWDKLWNDHKDDESRSYGRTAPQRQTPTPRYHGGAEAQEWHRQWCEAMLGKAGWLFAFGGTRTWHRLACAIEDSGWQIRDTVCWLYGQGFPKGKNTLKPAWEPILVARKYGDLDIDAARIPTSDNLTIHDCGKRGIYGGPSLHEASTHTGPTHQGDGQSLGRWPANLILDEEAGRLLDEQSGERGSYLQGGVTEPRGQSRTLFKQGERTDVFSYGDSGGASRFFYVAKSSRSERENGLFGIQPCAFCGGLTSKTHVDKKGNTVNCASATTIQR